MIRQTLNEYLDGGYTMPTVLDEATSDALTEWFGERYVIPKFDTFFKRNCDLYFPMYQQMLRTDPTVSDYDWFVENYLEQSENAYETLNGAISRQKTGSLSDSTSDSGYESRNGSKTDTLHISSVGSEHSEGTANNTSNDGVDSANRDMEHHRGNPMSAEYVAGDMGDFSNAKVNAGGDIEINANLGDFANPKIMNPSSSSDAIHRHEEARLHTSEDANEDDSTSTLTQDNSNIGTHQDIVTRNSSKVRSQSNNGTEAVQDNSQKTNKVHLINTGRNTLPAEVISRARACISECDSLKWLVRKLDKCFSQVYRVEDYDYE